MNEVIKMTKNLNFTRHTGHFLISKISNVSSKMLILEHVLYFKKKVPYPISTSLVYYNNI